MLRRARRLRSRRTSSASALPAHVPAPARRDVEESAAIELQLDGWDEGGEPTLAAGK